MTCCEKTYNLGCAGHCDTISTGVLAPSTGTYIISIVGSGGYISKTFTIGQEITFTNPFNEDKVTVFQIKKDGVVILTENHSDCFQVRVSAGLSL